MKKKSSFDDWSENSKEIDIEDEYISPINRMRKLIQKHFLKVSLEDLE